MPSLRAALALLEAAYQQGIRRFDTAPSYSQGYSELILGRFQRRHREIRVTTKCGLDQPPRPLLPLRLAIVANRGVKALGRGRQRGVAHQAAAGSAELEAADQSQPTSGPTAEALAASLNASRQRLGGPAIDTLLLHELPPERLDARAIALLSDLQQQGAVGHLGYGGSLDPWLGGAPLPTWMTVLQTALPADLPRRRALEQLLLAHPGLWLQVYGLFSLHGGSASAFAWLSALAQRTGRVRILFATRRPERIAATIALLGDGLIPA